MGARYPWYLLADSREGQQKEAEIARKIPSDGPVFSDIRQGFVYERAPHITLRSIANNAEIDVIWEKFQERLEPLRERLNEVLGTAWEEWEIPRDAEEEWPDEAKSLHARWWEERIARQKEINASIAAKADYEYLYDKPYQDKNKVRVAGPFTVESLSPHRVLGVDENDELIDNVARTRLGYGEVADFAEMILEISKRPVSSRRTRRTRSPSPRSRPGKANTFAPRADTPRADTPRAAMRTGLSAALRCSLVLSLARSRVPTSSRRRARPPMPVSMSLSPALSAMTPTLRSLTNSGASRCSKRA